MGGCELTAAWACAAGVMLAAGCDDASQRVEALPRSMCSQLVTGGGDDPNLLVVADAPTRGRIGASGRVMAEAVRLTLEQHRFRAGRHRLAFQSCDDSTARQGGADVERCAANGRAYGRNPAVVGVVGPVQSLCAQALLPEASRQGVAVVSPAATRIWLTRPASGLPDQSPRLYPTGRRTFFRVAAPDDEQARVALQLARRLGVRGLFAISQADEYGMSIRGAVRSVAPSAGIRTVGTATWGPRGRRPPALAREVAASGAGAVHLSGGWPLGGAEVAMAVRAELGPRFPIIASDGFVLGLPRDAARALEGMWITVPGLTTSALPERGQAIVERAGAAQPGALGPAYAAQAAEILISAIAASDGTRADVVRRLRTARLADGPAGPMHFDEFGDPVPRHMSLYRVRDGQVRPMKVEGSRSSIQSASATATGSPSSP